MRFIKIFFVSVSQAAFRCTKYALNLTRAYFYVISPKNLFGNNNIILRTIKSIPFPRSLLIVLIFFVSLISHKRTPPRNLTKNTRNAIMKSNFQAIHRT